MNNASPLVLIILDGWGFREQIDNNAIASAYTPQWDLWWKTCPHILLEASGQAVGLPDQQMGNSEVGHMHIGSGRHIPQDLTRINNAINTGSYASNALFTKTIETLKQQNKTLHVIGLLSPGGVHSHEKHLFAFLTACKKNPPPHLCLHLFLDGRDTPPQSALESLNQLEHLLVELPFARIASITGRYFAMDRDNRWDRTKQVYELLVEGHASHQFDSSNAAIHAYYQDNIYDEFVPPTIIGSPSDIHEGDAIFFFNFRADRARQLTETFVNPSFTHFKRRHSPTLTAFISMTQYADHLPTSVVFPPMTFHNTLGEVLSKHHLRQLRLAETEKYAHVTFFFNGGQEKAFPGEQRLLIPSPSVATYDLQPEMNAAELTRQLVDAINSQNYDIIICNYANADMVGHSGNIDATIKAIECLDTSMQLVWHALEPLQGQLLLTADHGNAECMYNASTRQAHTAHTNNPVPFLYVSHQSRHFISEYGDLADIAPTILSALGLPIPDEMTGKPLLSDINEH